MHYLFFSDIFIMHLHKKYLNYIVRLNYYYFKCLRSLILCVIIKYWIKISTEFNNLNYKGIKIK